MGWFFWIRWAWPSTNPLDCIRKWGFSNQLLAFLPEIKLKITFWFSSIIFLMKAICLIEVERGLMTNAGPGIFFLLTTTLSTNGWSSFLTQRENPVMSYSLIPYCVSVSSFFSGFDSSAPLMALSTSSWSVSMFENFNPSYMSISLKINSSMWVGAIKIGIPALINE